MTIVARANLTDRPFGRTFNAIAARGFTGDLVVEQTGRRFSVGWHAGAVVAADSSLPADAIARIALTAQLITSSQVHEILQASREPGDEVDHVAQIAGLTPDQSERLRRRALGQRAMRLFALEGGDLWLDDVPALPQRPDLAIDARALIYAGVKAHFGDLRLEHELASMGRAFRLREAAIAHLAQYGFGELERPALARLRQEPLGAPELEKLFPQVEPKVLRAMLYALAATGAVEQADLAPVAAGLTPSAALDAALEAPSPDRALQRRRTTSAPQIRLKAPTPAPSMVTVPSTGPVPTTSAASMATPSSGPVPTVAAPRPSDAAAIRTLIRDRLAILDGGGDAFALLGITRETSPDQLRAAYFELARQLHPDRLTAVGVTDEARDAQRLFAQINGAFAMLSNPKRRHEYLETQRAGGDQAVRAREEAAQGEAVKLLSAEEAFRKGEMALRRNQLSLAVEEFTKAVALNPAEGEHHALLAWATWCLAEDKTKVTPQTRKALDKAADLAPRSPTPHLYLGRIARQAGRDTEALAYFQRALSLSPGHVEATSEVRVLESRRGRKTDPNGGDKGKGLFGRFKR